MLNLNLTNDMRVNMKHIGEWAFRIGAVTVSIICIIKGNDVGAIWPIIALVFHLIACKFQDLCEDMINDFEALNQAHSEAFCALSDELAKKDAEITALKEEINRLKA